uniref:Uncharacterized protein n=1 Tax=Aegilops tauschii subsp. strangulata TaxID=200361 RepID=A0A453MA08_AEGTS
TFHNQSLVLGATHRSAMRTKSRSAATKEYLRAAAKMEAEMSTSCSSRVAPAQTSAAVSATAAALSGDGASSCPQRISDSGGREGPWGGFSAGGPPPPEAAQATTSRRDLVREGPIGFSSPRLGSRRRHGGGSRGRIGAVICAA